MALGSGVAAVGSGMLVIALLLAQGAAAPPPAPADAPGTSAFTTTVSADPAVSAPAAGPGESAPTAAVMPASVAAGPGYGAARSGSSGYDWPTGGPVEVRRAFDAPPERWRAGHRGVDLVLADGSAVRAAADGVVAFAGVVVDRGVVSIDHADGIRTTYEPVDAGVDRGQHVAAGEVIGQLTGPSHCAPEHCLHWGARRGRDSYLDPLTLLEQEAVIRLLPSLSDQR